MRTSFRLNSAAYTCDCSPKRVRRTNAQIAADEAQFWIELIKLVGAPFPISATAVKRALLHDDPSDIWRSLLAP